MNALPRTDWQQDIFSPADTAEMTAACRAIANFADGIPRTLREWSAISGQSEHATGARFSDLRRPPWNYVIVGTAPRKDSVLGKWTYTVTRRI